MIPDYLLGRFYYILILYSMSSLTLLVHLFTLFANYDHVVLERSCFAYIINIYFDIYGLVVSKKANNVSNKYTHKKYSKISQLQKERHSQNVGVFFEWVASQLFVTFFVNLPSLLSLVTYILNDPILLSYHNIFSNKSVLFQKHP